MSDRQVDPIGEDLLSALMEAREENLVLRREVGRLLRAHNEACAAEREAREDLATLLGLIAHQLKGPLLPLHLSLTALARAIARGVEIPPDMLPRALRQARRIERLIDALLVDLPHVEDGSLRVAITPFDLREPVRCVVDDLRQMIGSRFFAFKEPGHAVRVRGDPERVEQIVSSMLDNAVKYSPPGTKIEVRVHAGEQTEAIVAVADRGIGIPSRELNQVFTKFYRASNAPSYLYRGLGVGLYLSQRLAALCLGRLSLESVEGEGTTCRLHLPLDP